MTKSKFLFYYSAFLWYIRKEKSDKIDKDSLPIYYKDIMGDFAFYFDILKDFSGDELEYDVLTDKTILIKNIDDKDLVFDVVDGEFEL
jgi:hypothetical protein